MPYAQVDAYARGVVVGLAMAGTSVPDIQNKVRGANGMRLGQRTIERIQADARTAGGAWRVRRHVPKRPRPKRPKAGRPRACDATTRARIVKYALAHRGWKKVTAKILQKKVLGARGLSLRGIARVLVAEGFQYLPRRRKSYVPPDLRRIRKKFARRILRWCRMFLQDLIFVDGVTIWAAASRHQKHQRARKACGHQVWRLKDRSDALDPACVGSSKYTTAQGLAVKAWGALVGGKLFLHVLPAGENWNSKKHAAVVPRVLPKWWRRARGGRALRHATVLQDNERCQWSAPARLAPRKLGVGLVEKFPPYSPDLNPVENCWRVLKGELDKDICPERETRRDLVKRIYRALRRVNAQYGNLLAHFGSNMKERAREVLRLDGARTNY